MADDKATLHDSGIDNGSIAVCTTVSKNYLAFARVLSKSLREQHPSAKIFVLLVDHLEDAFDPATEPFELIEIEELDNIPEPKNFFFKYKPIELNTAAKPYFFEYLFRKHNLSKLIYLDPDILVLDSLKAVWDLLDAHNIVLTPHITEPYTDDRHPDEKHILQSGIFNLGFIAMANTPVTSDFLKWWQKRLYEFCFMDISQGMHVDQNWVNFAPVMFEGVHILKDHAYNIAYWNLHSRAGAMTLEDGKWKINGKPVVFFHFSGFDTDNIEQVSKHQNRFRLGNLPNIRPLFELYRDKLLANGHKACRKWRYAYGFFNNGVPVSDFIRKLYNAITKSGQYFSDPFSTGHSQSFFNWLNQSIDTENLPADIAITRLMAYIYSNRIDIKFAFRRPQGVDRTAFIQWFKTFAKREHQLDDAFIPGTERFKAFSSQVSAPDADVSAGNREARKQTPVPDDKKDGRRLPIGVNYAGYFKGEFGVAVAARNYIYALQTTQIPYVLNNIIAGEHRHNDRSFQEFTDDNPFFINIIHVNADQAGVLRNMKGSQYYKDRYNVGFWVWELEQFPKKWLSSFQYYQEIWVPSEFCKRSIERVSPVPVTKIKHPILMDEKAVRSNRSQFSIPTDEFTYLFVFDYLSVFERKNPLGMIRAFQKAFRKDDKVSLIIKSINSNQATEKAAYIQTITDGYNIRFIDRHLDPEDMLSLMASVDCFVSLHRSEGFGLGMAQSMYLGKPVIATGYSGNMDFMKPGNSFLVDYKLVELDKDYGPYEKGNVWAEPDIDHAAELMRTVYEDRPLAEKKAQQAAWDIRMELSPQAIGAEMQARIKQIYEGEKISFQKPTEVSIIIPVLNRLELTRQCLDTIRQTAGAIPYEIIVVDNGSNDGTADYLRQEEAAGRLKTIINNTNLGFAMACNLGAKAARGKYLLFLNNDTIPQPKWLDEMLRTAESDESIGIVGSKLLYPDGTIQHAGVAVWKNKRPYHIYKKCPADLPAANKQRDYQIVTAACMLVRKEIFENVRGFDERYLNGMEDVDFCLKVGRKNKRVVYNPRSVVIHLESQTEGRQDYMDANRVLFEQIWRDKIRPDDMFYLEQDGMEAMVDPRGSFYFVSKEEMRQMPTSVIIVTFNSAKTIRACLESVLQYTPNAEVIVVDNASVDGTQSVLSEYEGRVASILNKENKGFSFACNQGIRASKGEYVILLNPDTVVTPMWKERLISHFQLGVGAVGPLSNYTTAMQLSSFYAKDRENWETLKTNERAQKLYEWNRGQVRESKLLMGFCLALPRKVLDEAGLLDEDLFLGSEDLEISWRLRQKGYKLIIAADAFVYHEGQVSFKSRKTSTSDLTQESADKLYAKLEAHYGTGNVPHPMELWGIDYFKPKGARFRPMKPTFAAVYCVYDDVTWLMESLESIYDTVDAIYFLVSDRPWFGQPSGNTKTLEYIGKFPDPQNKIKIIQGTWTNETEQRNAGLDILKEAGVTYCFVIDADEIYDPAELKRMTEFAASHPEVDCWHMKWDTYWKTSRFRIEPREPFEPIVFIKVGAARFTKNRTAMGKNNGIIPPEVGICHHLSYARSDEEVLKKITTFSHAREVRPGWFENVWKKWDTDHSLIDLHPTHPHAYQRAVEQPCSALPPVLQKRCLADEKICDVVPGLTSIIILAHNRWDQTGLCLKSIGQHTPEPHEIIFVDNGSTDETGERLEALIETRHTNEVISNPSLLSFPQAERVGNPSENRERFSPQASRRGDRTSRNDGITTERGFINDRLSNLRVISNKTNRGFAAGCNQGIAAARGEYILLLNNDTIVTEGWLGRMIDVFKRHPKTGIVGPMSNNVTRPQAVENAGYEGIGGIDDFAGKWTKEHEGRSFTTYKASGFCLLAKREVIVAIGGLDERFGSGNFEDDDFCSRAFLKGFEIRIAEDVFIHHAGRQTFKTAGIDYNAKMARNWELYKAKWEIPKDTPLETYWVPSRLPEGVDIYVPLPDVSSDHIIKPGNGWWEEKEGPTKEKMQMEGKERMRGTTSVIMLLSGQREYARKCAETIEKHTKAPHEIIFIPYDPSYAPPKWLRKLLKEHPDYKVVDSTKTVIPAQTGSQKNFKLSFAQACNLGIAESQGEYIMILHDDTVVTEDWLTGMIECLESSDDAGIVGPMTVNVEGPQNIPDSYSSPEHLDSFAAGFREKHRYRRVPVKNLDSLCLLLKTELTEKIGLFDEGFGTDEYAADDYCIRAAAEGYRSLIAGDVFVHHYGRLPVAAQKDKIILGKKWGDIDGSRPESRKIYSANALFTADELNQKGQKEKAVVTLAEGMKDYPDDKRLRYALAEILIEDKKYKEAFDLLEQIPEGFAKDVRKLELMGSARIYMGLSEEADRYADEILLLNNASPKAWNLKGTVAFQKGAYAEAEKSFQKAIESDGGFGEAYANIGALRWAGGDKAEALRLFERALILSPTVEDIVTNYYTAVVSLSKLPEAERNFKEAVLLYPFNRRLKFILIDNLLQQGKYNEAMNAMEEAMSFFGIDDNTLTVALKLRDTIGPMEIQGSKEELKGSSVIAGSETALLSKGAKNKEIATLSAVARDDKKDTTISLCMIVKNEEENIVRSLMSVKPMVDEVIVVDTGSTDRTKKIAQAFGAKVYDFAWTESFSDARNFSLSKASGDWLLVLDADEVISPSDYGKLKELITPPSPSLVKRGKEAVTAKGKSVAYSFVTRNYVGPVSANWTPNDGKYKEEAGSGWFPSGKVRLFPNDSRVRFEKPVHETVEDSLMRMGMEIRGCDIPIHHYGKLHKEKVMAKGEEYYQLGKKKLAQKGEYDPKALYELAVQATELEKYDEALEFWKKLVAAKPDFAKAYYGMGTSYYSLARYEEACAAYKKAMEYDPDSKDAAVMYASSELLSGNADVAVSYAEALLKNDPGYPMAMLVAIAGYLCAGRKEKGIEYAKWVENTQYSIGPYLPGIAKLLISVKRYDYAIALLEAEVETSNVTAETRQLLDECYKLQKISRIQGAGDLSGNLKKNS